MHLERRHSHSSIAVFYRDTSAERYHQATPHHFHKTHASRIPSPAALLLEAVPPLGAQALRSAMFATPSQPPAH
jgi:hypothetical protein